MINRKDDIDITRNIKMIEGLKSGILSDISELYKNVVSNMREDSREEISESISNLMIDTFLLAKRLGITYNEIGLKIEKKLRAGIIKEREEEKYYGDLTELAEYINGLLKNN